MELQTKALDILFRRLSPEYFIRRLLDDDRLPSNETIHSRFLACAEDTLSGYSRDEQENILRCFLHTNRRSSGTHALLCPFPILSGAAERFLTVGANGPECRFEEAAHWRDAYLLLGQDLFTCAWLAQSPQYFRKSFFSWPAVIPTDNRILRSITSGAAENHMHLYAGASVFQLSWICLMNHPESREKQDILEKLLQARSFRGTDESLWSTRRKTLYAAFIRAKLFARVRGSSHSLLCQLREFDRTYCSDDIASIALVEEIDGLRQLYGMPFEQPGYQEPVSLDYAFTKELKAEREEHSRLLAGERCLLFSCFELLNAGKLSHSEQWIFYLYLLLKEQLRSELVQVNRQVGFSNFRDYDSRKKVFWEQYPAYRNEDIRQAINASLEEQGLSSLEGRICPEESAGKNISTVHQIDRTALFFGSDETGRAQLRDWEASSCMDNFASHSAHFFVLHFPKRADEPVAPEIKASLLCRHDRYRREIRACGIELAKALSNCRYFCERVRGIDACSQELVCRPEVFAPLFRFLRSFNPKDYWNGLLSVCTPKLSMTYHVGEDFLDISDGLRAMDEALHFLGLRHGDRFGHAIALGVDPSLHYGCKFNQSILSKQDLLDNLVWLYYRSSELQVVIPEPLRQLIRSKMHALFDYIYGDASPDSCYTLREYYNSMSLRGDDPRCYQTGKYLPVTILDTFDLFCENPFHDALHPISEFRRNERIAKLYYLYHYCLSAKRRGAETEVWTVDSAYLKLMKSMQHAMRNLLSRKGISIECNPSSNVLIGTFGSYQDHPIFTFNSMGLTDDTSHAQMHVSVNSDDPGVFDTTVSFEYALLARTLCDQEDENGRPRYSESQVEAYLRNIVRMGLEQVFPPCGRTCNGQRSIR